MQKFEKIKGISSFDNIPSTAKPGQWYIDGQSTRGQYLGRTSAGVTVINYKRFTGQIDQPHMLANKALRGFAKRYGSR